MKNIILLVLVAVSLAFEDCGLKGKEFPAKSSRYRSSDQVGKRQTIHGPFGHTAGQNEFPWQVLIKTKKENKFKCGGTLIEKDYVLTAAHCFSPTDAQKPSIFNVRLGVWRQYDRDGNAQEIPIKKIIRHEHYNGATMENDIALIQLAKRADCSLRYVGTACLPNLGDDYQGSENCWGSGWGDWYKPAPAGAQPNELQKVIGKIPDDMFVKRAWPDEFLPGMIGFTAPFTFEGETGSFSRRDSGGPVVCPSKSKRNRYDVVGIIGWGSHDIKSKKPEILNSVTYHLVWIKDNIIRHSRPVFPIGQIGLDLRPRA